MTDALDGWRNAGRTLRFGEHAVFYRSGGLAEPGTTLLCIHGLATASWDFQRVWSGLEARFGLVLAPDMLGFGFSPKPRGHAYSIAEQADLHEQLLREHGVSRVHILAHDYGDTVAQELLARHHERRARVLTFPFAWRRRLAHDGALLCKLSASFARTVQGAQAAYLHAQ